MMTLLISAPNTPRLSLKITNYVSFIIVHGFLHVVCDVVEERNLLTMFQLNVKGTTPHSGLNIEGTISTVPGGTSSELRNHLGSCKVSASFFLPVRSFLRF